MVLVFLLVLLSVFAGWARGGGSEGDAEPDDPGSGGPIDRLDALGSANVAGTATRPSGRSQGNPITL